MPWHYYMVREMIYEEDGTIQDCFVVYARGYETSFFYQFPVYIYENEENAWSAWLKEVSANADSKGSEESKV